MRHRVAALAVAACFPGGAALANPTNPTIVTGPQSALIQGLGTSTVTVTNSPNAIINWGSFSIGVNELTRFVQQSASSAVLNRVIGQDPSMILGALQSNGRVFLLNPSGIVFGSGAQIDVAGLVASTLKLGDEDFLNNRLNFTDGAGAGSVVNNGSMTGGNVYLVGNAVTNNGLITSPNGEVVLAAGNSVELVNPGTPDLRVEVVAPDNAAMNLGTISAEAGRIGIYAGLIDNSGTLNADSAVVEGGRIVLKATQNVQLASAAMVSASGSSGGTVDIRAGDTVIVEGDIVAMGDAGAGGSVQLLGHQVGLTGDAKIDVSGDTQGGTVRVGGDFQGNNPELPNAYRSYVGPDVTINADAVTRGDGGKVVVWADDATRFHGSIAARGGAAGGDGGSAEVSGKAYLDYQGVADLSAPQGAAGELLLDPGDVVITNTIDAFAAYGGGLTGSGGIFAAGDGTSTLTWATIAGNLAGGDVTVSTIGNGPALAGNINVIADSPDLNTPNKLSLVADQNISIGGTVSLNPQTFQVVETPTADGKGAITNSHPDGKLFLLTAWDALNTPVTAPVATIGNGSLSIFAPINFSGANSSVVIDSGSLVNQAAGNLGASGVITAHALHVHSHNQIGLGTLTNMVDEFSALSRGVLAVNFRNGKDLTIGAAGVILNQDLGNFGARNLTLEVSGGNLLAGGTITNTTGGNVLLTADQIGAAGSANFIGIDPGFGNVSLNSSGNVYLKQVSGSGLQTSRYAVTAPGGARVDLLSTGGDLVVDSSLAFGGIDLALLATGPNDINFAAYGGSVAAGSLTLGPDPGRAVRFGSGGNTWNINAPATVLNNALLDVPSGETAIFGGTLDASGTVAVAGVANFNGATALGTLNTSGSVLGSGVLTVDVLSQTAGTVATAGLNVLQSFAQGGGAVSVGGAVDINQASGNLDLSAVTAGGGLAANAASGNLIVDGGSLNAGSGPLMLSASGAVTVSGGSTVNAGSGIPGQLQLSAGGPVMISDSSVTSAYGGSAGINSGGAITIAAVTQGTVFSGGDLTLAAGTDLSVAGGTGSGLSASVSGSGTVTINTGGDVLVQGGTGPSSFARIVGSDVVMTVGGTVRLNDLAGAGSTSTIESLSPTTIVLDFPSLASGGYFVSGVENLIVDPPSNSGFFAGSPSAPAVLGSNLLVTYGAAPPPQPPPPPPSGSGETASGETGFQEQTLIVASGESVAPPEPEKDKDIFEDLKKDDSGKAPVCR